MIKREEADSGLRAGFVHEDDAMLTLPVKGKEPASTDIEKAIKEESPATPSDSTSGSTEPKRKEITGPTISMQGVSGKMITGVVKVVKRIAKADRRAEASDQASPDREATPESDAVAVSTDDAAASSAVKVSDKAAERATAKADVVSATDADQVVAKPTAQAQAEPAAQKQEAPAVSKPKSEPTVAPPVVETKVVSTTC